MDWMLEQMISISTLSLRIWAQISISSNLNLGIYGGRKSPSYSKPKERKKPLHLKICFFFSFGHTAYRILVPPSEIKLAPSAVEAQS